MALSSATPRALAYFAEPMEAFGDQVLFSGQTVEACDRQRRLPEPMASFDWNGEGWSPGMDSDALASFAVAPLDLESCLARGCLRREASNFIDCAPECPELSVPALPEEASCPPGWRAAPDSARCEPPAPAPCTQAPCWVASADPSLACVPSPRPPHAQTATAGVALGTVRGPLWLPRGRYLGDVHLTDGGALYGECLDETQIVGALLLDGAGGTVEGLSVEGPAGAPAISVLGGTARLARLRIEAAGPGLRLGAGTITELSSSRVESPELAVEIVHAVARIDHLWARAIGSEPVLRTSGASLAITASALETGPRIGGIWISDGGGAEVQTVVDQVYLAGDFDDAWTINGIVEATNLRIYGGGLGQHGLRTQMASSSRVQLERVLISDLDANAIWARATEPLEVSDLRALRVEVGLAVTGPVKVTRLWVQAASRYGVEVSSNGSLTADDVTLQNVGTGIVLVPNVSEGLDSTIALSSVLVEGAGVGLDLRTGSASLKETVLRSNTIGVLASPCLVDQALVGVRVEGSIPAVQLTIP